MADDTNQDSERTGKPRSRGLINASEIEMIPRHVGRIKRLRAAIEKASTNDNPEKIASLREELNRRIASLDMARQLLEDV